jgi:hypothetical protein
LESVLEGITWSEDLSATNSSKVRLHTFNKLHLIPACGYFRPQVNPVGADGAQLKAGTC